MFKVRAATRRSLTVALANLRQCISDLMASLSGPAESKEQQGLSLDVLTSLSWPCPGRHSRGAGARALRPQCVDRRVCGPASWLLLPRSGTHDKRINLADLAAPERYLESAAGMHDRHVAHMNILLDDWEPGGTDLWLIAGRQK